MTQMNVQNTGHNTMILPVVLVSKKQAHRRNWITEILFADLQCTR